MFFFKGFSKFNKTAVREVKYFYIKDTKDTRKKMFTIRSKKNYFKNIDFKERGGGEGVSKTILQGVILQRVIILVGNSP